MHESLRGHGRACDGCSSEWSRGRGSVDRRWVSAPLGGERAEERDRTVAEGSWGTGGCVGDMLAPPKPTWQVGHQRAGLPGRSGVPKGTGAVPLPGEPGALRGWRPAQQGAVSQVRNEEGKVVGFQCGLCECSVGNATARDTHVRGRRHRLQYKVCGAAVGPDRQVSCTPSHAPNRSSGCWGPVPHVPWRPRQTRPRLGSPWRLSTPDPPVAGGVPKHTEQAHRCSRDGAWGQQGRLGARGRAPGAPAAAG